MKGALIGFGYWGKILLANLPKAKSRVRVFDISKKALRQAKERGFKTASSLDELLRAGDIEFLIIAVPPSAHLKSAQKALEAGKHVLAEKPFGSSAEEGGFLFKLAKKRKKALMIDYSYIYSPGFQKLKELLEGQKMKSYESLRLNAGFPRLDAHITEDLIIHDLSMLAELAPSPPLSASLKPLGDGSFSSAAALISGKGWRAFIYASWVFSCKKRLVLVKSPIKAVEFKEEAGRAYVRFFKMIKNKKNPAFLGPGQSAVLSKKTALERMFEEFFRRAREGDYAGDFLRRKKISAILKALNKSLTLGGKTVKI